MTDFDDTTDDLETDEGRIHKLAGELYYAALLAQGYELASHFNALPHVDQLFFEALVAQALAAAARWRQHEVLASLPEPRRPRLAYAKDKGLTN